MRLYLGIDLKRITFWVGVVNTIYNRKYDKIPDFLVRLGGIIQAIMLIMKFLIMPFIQFYQLILIFLQIISARNY